MSDWHTASYSPNGSNCVECREDAAAVDVRDSQNREYGHLTFGVNEWAALVSSLKHSDLS